MSDSEVFLARSKNGIDVWRNPHTSHAATHVKDTPELESLAVEIIKQTTIAGDFMQFHVDMGRTVGMSDLVENLPGDIIMYAKRVNRDGYTAFNKSRPPQPSSLVTIALEKQPDGRYELVSTWIGPSDSPSFPDTERETADSKEFWSKHSLAWGRQEVQPNTETTTCPW